MEKESVTDKILIKKIKGRHLKNFYTNFHLQDCLAVDFILVAKSK